MIVPWSQAILGAILAIAAVYAYAALALLAHARLAASPPPRTLAGAILVGALMPACGCTALPYARRAPAQLRAPFLVAAYALNPLLVLAAAIVGGWRLALAAIVLALLAALAARILAPGERPRARLDDLLLGRGASPLRDAAPYTLAFAAPALGIGAAVGLAGAAPALVRALGLAALAILFAPRPRDISEDHGRRFARDITILHAGFAAAVGIAAWAI